VEGVGVSDWLLASAYFEFCSYTPSEQTHSSGPNVDRALFSRMEIH
jgi:hypothetical protein